MRYFLAIILPPVAVLLCGKPIQALLNLVLTLLLWVPGAVHACLVVHEYYSDKRAERVCGKPKTPAPSAAAALGSNVLDTSLAWALVVMRQV